MDRIKYYNENGFLLKSSTFKNGHLDGVLIEYTKFQNYSDALQIKKT
jgi:antitoxin component YwqK of YwqJK toxin-antitoxin module